MTETLRKTLRDSKAARWTALLIVAFTMFAGYYLADVMAPLKGLLENELTWNSTEYGFFTSAYGWFNVFLGFLIIGGIILDKMGVRFTGVMSSSIMVAGTAIKYWAISTHVLDGQMLFGWKAQVMVAALGYAIFGVGVEVAGITVSKIIVKWFRGHELALAMGLQLSIARLGTALAIGTSLPIALAFHHVSAPVLICLIMLCIGLIAFIIYTFEDKKLDASIASDKIGREVEVEEEFKISDIFSIIKNKGWWYIAILCVLFYSAVFPFLKYATDLMIQKFHINEYWAGSIPALLPFGTILLTPIFGSIYDKKGKGSTIMIIGAFLIVLVHLLFSIPILNHWSIAIALIIVLGIGFSLVPSAMWPSVPKIIPDRQLGTAYSLIFWVQNWGLMGVPLLIGWVVDKYCFIGYFALIGTGFTTIQGDKISSIVLKDNKVIELSQAGLITRKDTTIVISNLIPNLNGGVGGYMVIKGDTLSHIAVSDNAFRSIVDNSKLDVPMYTVKKGVVDHFLSAKGEVVSKYKIVTSFYNYTIPMLIFTSFGILAILFAFLLKAEDKKKGYGLEQPNIKS